MFTKKDHQIINKITKQLNKNIRGNYLKKLENESEIETNFRTYDK